MLGLFANKMLEVLFSSLLFFVNVIIFKLIIVNKYDYR